MDTCRLSKTMTAALNQQLANEAHASQIYLAFASWCETLGFSGIANFLFRHAEEERNHMMKILEYILKRGAEVKIASIPAPLANPDNLKNCFEKIFEHEKNNSKAIYKIVKMALDEEDWATWNFMQWFVKEQTEEETIALELLNKVKIAGAEKAHSNSLYLLDKDLQLAPDEARPAQDVTAANP